MSVSVNLDNLTLRPANGCQRLENFQHVARQWGPPEAGPEQSIQFHDLIETQEYDKDGKMVYWVLVPQHDEDTIDFYSCCRTYRRNVLVLHAGSDVPTTETKYHVAAVVTPPQHRGHSYARRMMSLLHSALATYIYPNPDVDVKIPSSISPVLFSTLYSDVGNYYERCGPFPHEPGWKIISPISTSWSLSETLHQLCQDSSSLLPLEPLSCEGVYGLLSSDVPDLMNLHRLPNTTYFVFAPTASIHLYKTTCSVLYPLHKASPDTHWGARTADGDNWVTWTFEYDSPPALQVTRLKSNRASFPALLLAALRAGELQGCRVAEAWNVPQGLIEVAESVGGATTERATHLPTLRWYGPQQADNIVWLMNELYIRSPP